MKRNTPARQGLEGAPNFRDLGGYQTVAGDRVRCGQIYRSEELSRLTSADLERVAAMQIGLVYDLRGADERQRDVNRWPAGRLLETVAGLEAVELDAVAFFGWRERIKDPSFDANAARAWMRASYDAMPRLFAGFLVSLFAHLGAASAPATLIHCTAGKDRTGFVSAMVLIALGVDRDVVFNDYMLTAQIRSPAQLLETVLGRELAAQPPVARAALDCMADVREEYLATAFDAIVRDFGTLDVYFSQACGLSPAARSSLCARLLE